MPRSVQLLVTQVRGTGAMVGGNCRFALVPPALCSSLRRSRFALALANSRLQDELIATDAFPIKDSLKPRLWRW